MRIGRGKPGSMRISESSAVGQRELLAQRARRRVGVAEAVEHARTGTPTACLTRRTWPGETKCGISTNGIVCPANTTSCSASQRVDLGLDARAAVAELGELDEVLELEVVDVVDQTLHG